eukprot:COSAG06_NODE_41640_length_382_cov_0.889655_1_plen_59_part_10
MNEDYELDVTRAEAVEMMRREFECVPRSSATNPAHRPAAAKSAADRRWHVCLDAVPPLP